MLLSLLKKNYQEYIVCSAAHAMPDHNTFSAYINDCWKLGDFNSKEQQVWKEEKL